MRQTRKCGKSEGESTTPTTDAQARQLLLEMGQDGPDLVKVYDTLREVTDASIEACFNGAPKLLENIRNYKK